MVREGGSKIGILGRFSRLIWGDKGREDREKSGKVRRCLLWIVPKSHIESF